MTRQLTYKDAVNEAIRLEMRSDPSVILIGEDVLLFQLCLHKFSSQKGRSFCSSSSTSVHALV